MPDFLCLARRHKDMITIWFQASRSKLSTINIFTCLIYSLTQQLSLLPNETTSIGLFCCRFQKAATPTTATTSNHQHRSFHVKRNDKSIIQTYNSAQSTTKTGNMDHEQYTLIRLAPFGNAHTTIWHFTLQTIWTEIKGNFKFSLAKIDFNFQKMIKEFWKAATTKIKGFTEN